MGRFSANSTRTRLLWIVISLLYGGLRVALAGAFLTEYGLNIWPFAIVEMTSSLVLGVSSGALLDSIVRARRGRRLLLVAGSAGGYAAPDVYVLAYSGRFPATTLIVVASLALIGLASTTVTMRRGMRNTAHADIDRARGRRMPTPAGHSEAGD